MWEIASVAMASAGSQLSQQFREAYRLSRFYMIEHGHPNTDEDEVVANLGVEAFVHAVRIRDELTNLSSPGSMRSEESAEEESMPYEPSDNGGEADQVPAFNDNGDESISECPSSDYGELADLADELIALANNPP